jgi:glycerol kinase
MIFDRRGNVVGKDQLEHAQLYPNPGWVEHDPLEIWARAEGVVRGALDKSGITPGELAALGVTNQRETTVVWNRRTGKPYFNAIVWQDTRTDKICGELAKEGGQDRFREKTGLPLATYFSAPKIRWILDNVAGVREEAERGDALFGNIDTWIVWNLTGGAHGGVHVTDASNASRTLLMNLGTLTGMPRSWRSWGFPSDAAGHPPVQRSELMGGPERGAGVRRPGDQQAALVGQTCFGSGEAKNTYGTGCFMLLNTGTQAVPSKSGLLTTVGYKFAGEPTVYALEGSIAITGALVQWLRDNLSFFDFSQHIEDYANRVPDSGGIYIVPAFSGLFAPYWQADARGVIVGLTRFINKNHICRAALEATAYQTREVLDAMEHDSGVKLTTLKVDGGMVHNDMLMQFQADILGVPVVRPKVAETTALGAAYAAGLAVGFWNSPDDLRSNWQVDQTWQPAMRDDERSRLYRGWLKAVQRAMHWLDE